MERKIRETAQNKTKSSHRDYVVNYTDLNILGKILCVVNDVPLSVDNVAAGAVNVRLLLCKLPQTPDEIPLVVAELEVGKDPPQ